MVINPSYLWAPSLFCQFASALLLFYSSSRYRIDNTWYLVPMSLQTHTLSQEKKVCDSGRGLNSPSSGSDISQEGVDVCPEALPRVCFDTNSLVFTQQSDGLGADQWVRTEFQNYPTLLEKHLVFHSSFSPQPDSSLST